MGTSNKNIKRNRTKPIRVNLADWMVVDKVAGEDRPMKDGFHEIVEEYKKDKNMEIVKSLEDLGE